MIDEILFIMVKDKAVDYYNDNFGPVSRIGSDFEKNTFWFYVHNKEYKNLVEYIPYKRLSEDVEQITYKQKFNFERYGISLPIKWISATKKVEIAATENKHFFKVTYTITDIKDDEPYFMNLGDESVYESVQTEDCGDKLAEFIENTFFKDAFVMYVNDSAKYFTIAMHKDFQSLINYFIVTNVKPCPDYELLFKCIRIYSSNVNPEIIEQTYVLESIRPKKLTFKCVGKIVDDGEDFNKPDSCESDPVNHPNHYEMVGPFESFDIIIESLGIDGARQFCQGNIIKYQTRYRAKNGEEDLKKRHWYSRMDQMLAKCKTIEDYYKLKESDF